MEVDVETACQEEAVSRPASESDGFTRATGSHSVPRARSNIGHPYVR
jgi:hypothetical protein